MIERLGFWPELFGSLSIALTVTSLSMPFLIKILKRSSVMDIPNQRSSHSAPVPRGGGALIALALLIGIVFSSRLTGDGSVRPASGLFLGVAGFGALGFLDDLYSLQAKTRLVLQVFLVGGSLLLMGSGNGLLDIPGLGPVNLGPGSTIFGLVFVVGFTNMFNFMDGINGLAGFQAVVAGLGMAIAAFLAQDPFWPMVLMVLVGSSVGFLFYNFPNAKIFLGDVGSLPVGYLLAVGVLHSGMAPGNHQPPAFWVQVLFIWPFLFEATWTLLLRIKRRQNPFEAHRSHLYQLFVIHKWSHARVTLLYGAVMAGFASLALTVHLYGLQDKAEMGALFWLIGLLSGITNLWLTRRFTAKESTTFTLEAPLVIENIPPAAPLNATGTRFRPETSFREIESQKKSTGKPTVHTG